MIVIGLTGPIGSGKDAVSNYLEDKHDFKTFSCGDAIREIAKEEDLEPTRENLQMIGKKYRKRWGNGFLGKKAAEMVNESEVGKTAVNGIRSPEEVDELRSRLGDSFVLVYVHAGEKTRFQRLKERGRTGDPQTVEDFRNQDRKDKEKFGMEETFSLADRTVVNEQSLNKLYGEVEKLLKDIKQ